MQHRKRARLQTCARRSTSAAPFEQRKLAERLSGRQRGDLRVAAGDALDGDGDGAGQDGVKVVANVALYDDSAASHVLFVRHVLRTPTAPAIMSGSRTQLARHFSGASREVAATGERARGSWAAHASDKAQARR